MYSVPSYKKRNKKKSQILDFNKTNRVRTKNQKNTNRAPEIHNLIILKGRSKVNFD